MPQAPSYLQAMFEDDHAAWKALGDNFTDTRGVIRAKPGHVPTQREFHAIDYLILEWDYAYSQDSTNASGVAETERECANCHGFGTGGALCDCPDVEPANASGVSVSPSHTFQSAHADEAKR